MDVDTKDNDIDVMDTSTRSSSPCSSSTSEHWVITGIYGQQWKKKVKRRPRSFPLRVLAKLVVMSVRLCRQSMDNLARRKGEYESVMQVLDEYGAQLDWAGMSFIPQDYRANKQQNLHKGVRRLLESDPRTRTENDINTLLVALRNIPAFAEYPKKMQQKLCQVGHLETYEPRRVILREGDPPTSFYFILSGTVLVTAFEESSGTSRTLVALKKGMSFGELAVISNTKRQATVCSNTDIELLSISGEEFEEIFMAGGRDVMASERQQEFIRSVRFLQNWPTNELRGKTDSCSVYYFDRNQILVRDSNNSDWIYIVLKGSLSVIKKLKTLDPQKDLYLPPHRPKVTFTRSIHRHQHERKNEWKSFIHSRIAGYHGDDTDVNNNSLAGLEESLNAKMIESQPKLYKNAMELEHRLERTLPGYHNSVDRLGSLNYDRIIQEHKERLIQRSPVLDSKRHSQDMSMDTPRGIHNDQNVYSNITRNSDSEKELVKNGQEQSTNTHETQCAKNEQSNNVHKTSFLPDISIHNKVVGQTNHRIIRTDEMKNGNNLEYYDEGNDADNEDRSSLSSSENFSHRKAAKRKTKKMKKTSKGVYLASTRKENDHELQSQELKQTRIEESHTSGPDSEEQILYHAAEHKDSDPKNETIREKLANLQIEYHRRITDGEGRKTIAEELDYKGRRDYKFTEADLDPTVIEIQVLERGQYFGVSSMLFPDQPSLSVISNGAECVVMSKKFFLQLASDKCITSLRHTETPYPTDQQLGIKLQEAINWQATRAIMFKRLQNDVLKRKAKRKQFQPSQYGQYCFRTGPT